MPPFFGHLPCQAFRFSRSPEYAQPIREQNDMQRDQKKTGFDCCAANSRLARKEISTSSQRLTVVAIDR